MKEQDRAKKVRQAEAPVPAGRLTCSLISPLPDADGRNASALVLPHGTMAQEVACGDCKAAHDLTSLIPDAMMTGQTPATVTGLDIIGGQGMAQGRRTERSAAGSRRAGVVAVSVTG